MASIGLVGFGVWGQKLARVLWQADALDAIVDQDMYKLSAALALYPTIRTFETADAAFDSYLWDAVVIAVPPKISQSLVHNALTCGLHVLTEKPLALSYDAALGLCDLADKANRILMVDHTFNFSPAVNLIWSLVKSGVIGELKHISLKRADMVAPRTIDVLWDLAVHDLTIVHGLAAGLPTRIWARKHHLLGGDLADHATLNLEYDDFYDRHNLVVNIEVSWVAPTKVRQGLFIGTEGMIVYDDLSPDCKVSIHERAIEMSDETFYKLGDTRVPLIIGREPLAVLVDTFMGYCGMYEDKIVAQESRVRVAEKQLTIYQILDIAERSHKEDGRCVFV